MNPLIGEKGVKYGLQVRKPEKKGTKKPAPPKPSIFGDEASDEEEDNVEKQIARHATRKQNDRKVAEIHAAALAEDASVFDYDSHFDSIQEARAEPKRQEKMARESRYIASLLEKAEERKREQDVQYERQLAKERAAEDHLYGDKERFVTATYKKKLEEEAKWKAEQKQKQEEEEKNAVEKKGHMGDFYRNILRNNVAFGTAAAAPGVLVGAEKTSGSATTKPTAIAGGEKQRQANKEEDTDIMPERRAEMEARAAAKSTIIREQQAAPRQPPSGGGSGGGDARSKDRRDNEEEELLEKREIPSDCADLEESSRREQQETGAAGVEVAAAVEAAALSAAPASRRNRENAVAAARERYLARKRKADNVFIKIVHCGESPSFKSARLRAATAVVATPLFGSRRPCSTLSCGRPSQSRYLKLQSISSREVCSALPAASHIPRAAKDDDAQLASAAEPYMPEEWPDFSKKKIYPDIENKFFNRKKEHDMIMGHLNRKPSKPLLLLGPINSGKSALAYLIKEKEKSRVIYLNCGIDSAYTPELMAQELRTQARMLFSQMGIKAIKILVKTLKTPASSLVALLSQFVDTASPTVELLNACESEFFPEDTSKDLTAVINTYKLILGSIASWKKEPIFVIDEFNVLRQWKAKDKDALQNLLEFLKRICKEKKRAHILLASSDFFMISWLSQRGFDGTQRKVQVLGDLTREEAFVYVCGGKVDNRKGFKEEWPGLMAQSQKTKKLGMTPEDWKKVWSVCGGNMYLLLNCVADAADFGSWDEGVAETLSEPQEDVATALERPESIPPPTDSTGPRIWEAKHYKAVLRLIAASPYHAVRRREVHAALMDVKIPDNVTADQVLLSMVEFNVLSLRPYSAMDQDIPREAFFKKVGSKEKKDSVVTMRSPAHLAAVLELDVELEEQQSEIKSA